MVALGSAGGVEPPGSGRYTSRLFVAGCPTPAPDSAFPANPANARHAYMQLFLEFASQQWILIAALLAAIGMLIAHEARKAGPALSPQQAINLVNREGGVFVDLRDAAAYKKGHIVDALHIPATKLGERKSELEAYRDRPVVLVCAMGQSAGNAAKQLRAAGHEKAYKMGGGMMEWTNLQLPTVTG